MKIDISNVHPLILEKFGLDIVSKSGRDEYIYHCIYCEKNGKSPDTKGKLYVNNKSLKYHCFRCGESGQLLKDSKGLGYNLDFAPLDSELGQQLEDFVMLQNKTENVKLEYSIPKLYPVKGTNEYQYLINRGITDSLIKYYDIRMGSIVTKFANRIIIPNRVTSLNEDEDLTDMFVARYIYKIPQDDNGNDLVQRYLNPFGTNRRKVVFNLHRIKDKSPIIITEGCITAIAAGFFAVGTYGKLVTDIQLKQILNKKPSKLYINLDGDAYKETLKLCSRIEKIEPDLPLYIVRFKKEDGDHADAADVGRDKYLYYLKNAHRYNRMELKLMETSGINHKYLDAFL